MVNGMEEPEPGAALLGLPKISLHPALPGYKRKCPRNTKSDARKILVWVARMQRFPSRKANKQEERGGK